VNSEKAQPCWFCLHWVKILVTQKTNFLKGDNFSVLQQLYQTPITQKIAPLPFIIKPCVWLFGVSTAVNVSHQVARTHTSDRLLIMRKQQTYKEEKKASKLYVFFQKLCWIYLAKRRDCFLKNQSNNMRNITSLFWFSP